MVTRRVVMGLLFFPRGGSAYAARSLSRALADAGSDVSLVCGSLGPTGADTNAGTFFAGIDAHAIDYSDALAAFEAGGSGVAAPVPMQPSFEDRDDVADVVLASVDPELADHLASAWTAPFAAAQVGRADVVHLHHLTPQHDAIARGWPDVPVVAHLHGTEIKFVEEVAARAAAGAADRAGRADHWRHGRFWAEHLRAQANAADHLVVVSSSDRASAVEQFGVEPERVSVIPNGVDTDHFRPVALSAAERRAAFRHWLVADPRGWDETGVVGSVAYRERDLDRLLGPDGDGTVLVYVGRFTSAKRVPVLIRAFARARERFERPASLLVWGGSPGEWEDEHPVTVAAEVGADGIFFAGWRGHDDLPLGLAACDALVMSSVNDSFPQAPLEAMAVGLPVIATRSGGFPSMIDVGAAHPTGWLVAPDDVDALARALVDAVNHPAELRRRGAHALDHARASFSWAGLVPRFEHAYAAAATAKRMRI